MTRALKSLILIIAAFVILTGCSNGEVLNETTKFVTLGGSSDFTISEGGTYNLSGTLTEAKIKVTAESDVTLILSGLEIVNSTDEALKIESGGVTTIKADTGTVNTLSGGGDAAINAKSSIILDGSGTLNINGTQCHGIECDGDITVKGGKININSYEHAVKSEAVITILGGDINIVAETGKGIKAEKKFLAENGNVKINSIENEGLESKGELTINGGNFDIIAGEDGINAGTSDSTDTADAVNESAQHISPDYTNAIPEGGEGTGAIPPEDAQPENFRPGKRFPMGGEGEPKFDKEKPLPEGFEAPEGFEVPEAATTSGRGIPFEFEEKRGGFGRVNADSVLTINGGSIKINCLGDGIDSNGSLSINGGTVIIDGPENSENGPLDSDGEMIINGGTVLTASAKGMTQMPRSMSQGILSISFDTALSQGDEIVIMDSQHKILADHTVGRICEALLYTSPEISENEQYTVYVNGNEYSVISASDIPHGNFGGNWHRPPMPR